MRGVDRQVIRPELVDSIDFDVLPTFAQPSVTTLAFATIDLVERAMNSHQKDVEWLQELGERRSPGFGLDDVLHDQVVAGCSEHGDAAMEAVEESRPNVAPPKKWPVGVSPLGQSDRKDVGRDMQEGLVQRALELSGQRRFPAARCPMKQDDPTNPCVRVHLDSLVLRHATGER
jgi:hypothetical protein